MKKPYAVRFVSPGFRFPTLPVLLLWMASLFPREVVAATKTWNGSTSANWIDAANWTAAGAPANGDTLVFPAGQPRPTNTNNILNLVVSEIRFTGGAGGYAIWGNAFALTNRIEATNTAGANTINNPITLTTTDVTINLAGNATLTLRGELDGSVGVVKTGAGTLDYDLLGGANSYSGNTRVNAGTLLLTWTAFDGAFAGPLIIGDGSGMGSPVLRLGIDTIIPDNVSITINNGALLDLNGYDETIGNRLTLNGDANIQTGAGRLTLGNNSVVTVDATNYPSSIAGKLNVGAGTCQWVVNGSYASDVNATVSGTADILKTGNSVLVLEASNSFSGNVHVQEGILNLWSPWALGDTNGVTTVSNQAWLILSTNLWAESLFIYTTNTGAVTSYGTSNVVTGNIFLGSPTFISVATNRLLNLLGVVHGPGGFTKLGPGTLRLSGNSDNTYLGVTRIYEGALELNKSADAYAIFSDREVIVGDGVGGDHADVLRLLGNGQLFNGHTNIIASSGVFDLNNHGTYAGPFILNGGDILLGTGTLFMNAPSRGLTVSDSSSVINGPSGMLALTAPIRFDIASGVLFEVQTPVSGAGGIVKSGTGEMRLSYSNSYAGLTLLQEGSLEASLASALGTTNSGTIVSNGATLMLLPGVTYLAEPLVLNGVGTAHFGALDLYNGIAEWTGPVTLAADSRVRVDSSSGNLRVTGVIDGPGGITKTGGGNLSLEGAGTNVYDGPTWVCEGKLRLAKTAGVKAVPGQLVIGDGTGGVNADIVEWGANHQVADTAEVMVDSSGLLLMTTNSESVGSIAGPGNLNLGGSGMLYFGGNPNNTVLSGSISGGSIFKGGWSTVTLAGTNTNPGYTYAMVGTLVVNGYQPGRPVWVGTSGTLAGTGIVGHVTVDSGGKVAPGASPGLLTCSNLTFNSTGVYPVELNDTTSGTGYDQLKVRGSVNLGNASLDASLGFASAISNTFTIIDNDGADAVIGTFSGLAEEAMVSISGTPFRISYLGGTGNDVTLTQLTPTQQPLLGIAPASGTNVVLWWPTNFTGFAPEASTNLTGNVWSAVSPQPVVLGTNNVVTNAASGRQHYYRLHRP